MGRPLPICLLLCQQKIFNRIGHSYVQQRKSQVENRGRGMLVSVLMDRYLNDLTIKVPPRDNEQLKYDYYTGPGGIPYGVRESMISRTARLEQFIIHQI